MQLNENTVVFETPLKRGESEIKQVELIKPTAGSLRGVRLADLCQSDVDALLTVLPRITLPSLTKAECNALDPIDLISLGGKVIGFFADEVGRIEWPTGLTVNDLMADVATIFHWPPSEMYDMPLAELMGWRHKAFIRSGATPDEQ